jgi:tetratricopeptide (TPR) repeat protein
MVSLERDGKEANPMSNIKAEELYTMGMEALKSGNTGAALEFLEKAIKLERNPLFCSSLALCLAKEKRDFKEAVSLCKEAIKKDPKNSIHFLNLGKIHILANQKKDALRILNMGLRYEDNREIIAELQRFGRRRPPVIPFLERSNPLNKYLGKLLYKQRVR